MSTPPTLGGVTRSLITSKWREAIVGGMTLLIVMCMGWITSDIVSSRDKLKSLPDPAQIATNVSVDQRFAEQDRKISENAAQTHESLVRIESKLDTLIMSMATRRRDQARATFSDQAYQTPYESTKASAKPSFYGK